MTHAAHINTAPSVGFEQVLAHVHEIRRTVIAPHSADVDLHARFPMRLLTP